MHTLKSRRRRLNRLVAALGVAMSVIVCACFAIIIWIISVSSASLDQTQKAGEKRLLTSITNGFQQDLARALTDYTAWNELYEYFEAGRPQSAWERNYLGPYITATFGIDHVVGMARNGAIVYSFRRAGQKKYSAKDIETLSRLARQAFAAEKPNYQVGISGFVEFNGTPSLAAAATIRRSSLDKPSHFALIEVREFSRSFLDRTGLALGIAQLRVERAAPQGVMLRGPSGAPSPFDLIWKPSDSGRRQFIGILPSMILVGAGALIALLGLVFVLLRVAEHLREVEARMGQAELEASKARARAAEETSQSKSAFIANMSHELRTPLNAIIGFSDMIVSEVFGSIGVAKYREYVVAIYDSGHHLLGIVNDILQVSKIEAGSFDPVIERIVLGDVVHDCVRMLEVLALKRDIRINLRLDPQPCEVLVDRQALQQILINILSNALKFSPEHAGIDVTCAALPHEYELCVTDHGCGIPARTLRELGKPFVQAEGVYSRQYQGTGLGLTVSFLLAKAMGASIHIESTEGVGTQVRIRVRKGAASATVANTSRAA